MKGKNVGDSLRKFARDNKDMITEADLALGFFNMKANCQMNDISNLAQLIKTKFKTDGGKNGDMISIAQVTALLG